MLDASDIHSLPRLVSAARFKTYLAKCSGREDLAARLYTWNIEATSAFWGPVRVLEVVLRNAIHDALREGRREDWWNEPSVRLMNRDRHALDRARENLVNRGIGDPTADRVVAATSLGLWVGPTDEGIPRDPYLSYETGLWQPRIVRAFPHAGTVRRKELHRALDDVRVFRNRLAHHEPIFAAPLPRMRDRIIRLAGFIDVEAADLIRGTHRIDAVLKRRQASVELGHSVI